jgi:hypothetical protein
MNFNDPVEVLQIFRIRDKDIKGNPVVTEYANKICFVWEDLKRVEEYAYPDNWETYKGNKCNVMLEGDDPGSRVILYDYEAMKGHWTNFRRSCPLYVLKNGAVQGI